ncbi:hypothetical protein [Rhodococcus pyridinivorans]|uniref:hypothetical protein n=1 Tax=Rhodococcus pyridinivorans TaxID=103816 RepID=UPI00265912E4|nr:hypothetical protein [Rhodococcus pyridinivorans]
MHERNDQWSHPLSDGDVYVYTVESVERIGDRTVHVGVVGGDIASSLSYELGRLVAIEPR